MTLLTAWVLWTSALVLMMIGGSILLPHLDRVPEEGGLLGGIRDEMALLKRKLKEWIIPFILVTLAVLLLLGEVFIIYHIIECPCA